MSLDNKIVDIGKKGKGSKSSTASKISAISRAGKAGKKISSKGKASQSLKPFDIKIDSRPNPSDYTSKRKYLADVYKYWADTIKSSRGSVESRVATEESSRHTRHLT